MGRIRTSTDAQRQMGKELGMMDKKIYVVTDNDGYICVCADEELAQKTADKYWCWYDETELATEENDWPEVRTFARTKKGKGPWGPLRR